MIKFILIFLIFVILGLIVFVNKNKEPFCGILSIVNPFSLYLHDDIMKKADWWNATHRRKLYYYHNMVPQHYKE